MFYIIFIQSILFLESRYSNHTKQILQVQEKDWNYYLILKNTLISIWLSEEGKKDSLKFEDAWGMGIVPLISSWEILVSYNDKYGLGYLTGSNPSRLVPI